MREKVEFEKQQANPGPAIGFRHGGPVRPRRIGRRSLALLTLAATLCGAGLAYGQNNKQDKKDKKKEAEVSTASLLPDNQALDLLVSQMLGAWQAGDADGMRKFYADDVLVVSGAWEQPIIGWANYAIAYQSQMARTAAPRLERTNSYTKVMGETAWVTYQWQFAGDVDSKPTQAFGHTTLVLQKRAGNWLIVVNHTSAIPTDEAPAVRPSASTNGQPGSSLAPNAR
jgi:ketosteroid isomerase-like protein